MIRASLGLAASAGQGLRRRRRHRNCAKTSSTDATAAPTARGSRWLGAAAPAGAGAEALATRRSPRETGPTVAACTLVRGRSRAWFCRSCGRVECSRERGAAWAARSTGSAVDAERLPRPGRLTDVRTGAARTAVGTWGAVREEGAGWSTFFASRTPPPTPASGASGAEAPTAGSAGSAGAAVEPTGAGCAPLAGGELGAASGRGKKRSGSRYPFGSPLRRTPR